MVSRAKNKSRKNRKRHSRRRMTQRPCLIEPLEDRQLLAANVLFADSFESGSNSNDWAGSWVEDSQNDWFRSTQRATDGSHTAEVDGAAIDATLNMAQGLDLTSHSDVQVSFDWYIESGFDGNDYLALDFSPDGQTWTEIARLNGNGAENTWQHEQINVAPTYLTDGFQLRYRAKIDGWFSQYKDANVDNVQITGEPYNTEPVGLISYWTADDTATDAVGDNDGTPFNGTGFAPGHIGQSFVFDGVDDRIVVADDPSLRLTKSMTIEGWIRVDSYPDSQQGHSPILFRGDDRAGLDPYVLTVQAGGSIQFSVNNSTEAANVASPIPKGEFVYVVATLDDATGEMQLYLNGVLMSEITTAVRPFGNLEASSHPSIGIGNHGGWPDSTINFPFHGAIDELKIHDVALSDAEILANFQAQKGDLQPAISINDVTVTEGDPSYSFKDTFVSAGDGGLTSPRGLAFGPDGNLYVVSADTDSILRYDSSTGTFIDAFVPTGSGGLDLPWDIAFHDGDLYVTSNQTNSVLRYNGTTGAFVGEFVSAGSGGLEGPRGLLFGDNDELYVTSTKEDDAVLRYDATTGNFQDEFIASGAGGLNNPTAVQIGPDGNFYVSNTNAADNSVLRYDTNGDFLDVFVGSGSAGLDGPTELLFDNDAGLLYVCSARGDTVLAYDSATGAFVEAISTVGSGLDFAISMTMDTDGRFYVSSRLTNEVLRFERQATAVFDVTLSTVWPDPVTVDFDTADGTATAGSDYGAQSGTVTFMPGEISQAVVVPIADDSEFETDETFEINLSGAVGAAIADAQGIGTILDDGDPASQPPVADDDAYSVAEDAVLNVAAPGVLDGDTDPENDPLTAVLVAGASHGAVALSSDGSFTYTPDADYYGSDSFTYSANDGTSDSNVATVAITVTPVNDAPVADSPTVAVKENTNKAITLSASDVENDPLTYSVQTGPTSGTLSGTAPNLIYKPNFGFNGTDSFTFLVNDGTDDSDLATVTVNVANNIPPVADSQTVSVDEDGAVVITLTGSDADGDPIGYAIVDAPVSAILSGAVPNVTYTPDADFFGTDSFTFRVDDGTDDSALATVTITVDPVNDAPVADPQTVSTSEDTAKAITLTGSDIEGDVLDFIVVNDPAHGTLTGSGANRTYTPDVNYHGSDSFTFKANDGAADSEVATIAVTVDSVNDAPVAQADNYAATQDTPLSVAAAGVLQNDSDVDGDPVSVVQWSGTSAHGGKVDLNSDGSLSYIPPTGFVGTDTFSYVITDGSLNSDPATISIKVSAASANALFVYDIRFESVWFGWYQRAVFEIRSDSNGDGQGSAADDAAAGVEITVEFNGHTYTGTTDSNGIFRTSWNRGAGSGTYGEVVDLALADYSWDPLSLDLENDSNDNGLPDAIL
jgi:VCBS repeat-containing protein